MKKFNVLIRANKTGNEIMDVGFIGTITTENLSILRNVISKHDMPNANQTIKLIITLFHRDEMFKDMFFENVKITDKGKYELNILKWNKKGNLFNSLTIKISAMDNWKIIKKFIMAFITDRECPICYNETESKLSCSTCYKSICYDCLLTQYYTSCHLRCPLCNISMDGLTDMEQNHISQMMKRLPIEDRKEIASANLKTLYGFSPFMTKP